MLIVAVATGLVVASGAVYVRADLVDRLPRALTVLAAAAGAAAVVAGDVAPTGWIVLDVLAGGGIGAVVPLGAARAGAWTQTWVVLVAAAACGVSASGPVVLAGAAAGVHLGLLVARARTPVTGAVTAAAAVASLAHLDWDVAAGVSAVAGAVGIVPLLVVGYRRGPAPARRVARWSGAVVVAVVLAGSAVGLLAALDARTDVDVAVDLAVEGLDALGGDDDRASDRLTRAAARFDAAEDTMRSWWARPALLVPVVAQQSRAVATMAGTGEALARTAVETSESADIDAVQPRDGRVDLGALEDLAAPLADASAALTGAAGELDAVDSPVLLEPVDRRLRTLTDEVDGARDRAAVVSDAVAIAPDLLGADGPRRYFLAFQNPAEARGNGGFMGNWAELVADDGRLELTRTGRVRELTGGGPDPGSRRIRGEEEFVARYGQDPAVAWGLIGFTPDHPTVGRIIQQLYPQSGGTEIDGVIAVTPAALAAFLELTGPIEVAGYPTRLDAGNAERILLHDQYLAFPTEASGDREEFLVDATEVLFDELTTGELPGPSVLARELGPAVEAQDLQFWSADPDEQAFFERIGSAGSATRQSGDAVGVIGQNFAGNKIDWFLRRHLHYDAVFDPATGEVEGTITVTFDNQAPASGLPSSIIGWGGDPGTDQIPTEPGENLMWVTVFAGAPVQEVTLDGEPVDHEVSGELGHATARLFVSVPAGATRTLEVRVAGVVSPADDYRLEVLRQPTVAPDRVTADIRLAPGWTIGTARGGDGARDEVTVSEAAVSLDATAATPVTVRVDPDRDRGGLRGLIDTLRHP